jgi:hypothetical protein
MAFLMEKDKSLDPANIRLLCIVAEMSGTDRLSNLIEELGFRRRRYDGRGIRIARWTIR